MPSKIFLTLLQRQIDTFVATFQNDGTSLFKDGHNTLIHPGEYGVYRERCFCSLLRSVLTRDCSLSDGFIFSAQDNYSTQCDILVKNAMSMPLMDGGIAKFHPVEDVYAVVEMKSNLTKKELKDTLRKLAEVKMIGDDRTTRREIWETNPQAYDAIPTFLVCNRIQNFQELNFDDIYEGIDRKYWHNAILSVEDGLFKYRYSPSDLPPDIAGVYESISYPADSVIASQYSQLLFRHNGKSIVHNCEADHIPARPDDKYAHIILFLSMITQVINLSVKYQFDSVKYAKFEYSDQLGQ